MRRTLNSLIGLVVTLILVVGCSTKQVVYQPSPPDIGQDLQAVNGMVSAAHKLASAAGVQILNEGGNAIDAAVATAFAVSVTEPQMSGIGGGGGAMVWLNKEKQAYYIDFYASKRVRTYTDLPRNGDDAELWEIGIPGEVAGLLYLLEKYGNLSRSQVMAPAIELAERGFTMYPTLAEFISSYRDQLLAQQGGALFVPQGEPFPVGKTFKQPELARTLKIIAEKGADAFYQGELTKDMVETMNKGGNPVTAKDFSDYKVNTQRGYLESTYKNWKIFTAAPPQGGLEIIQDLNLLESFDLKALGLPTQSDSTFHILAAAMRAGIAGRKHSDDPNWSSAPVSEAGSKNYARERAPDVFKTPIGENGSNSMGALVPHEEAFLQLGGETTSLSVIDQEGNGVALTHTLSFPFGGNAVWVNGYFLNNSASKLAKVDASQGKGEYLTRYSTIAPTLVVNQDHTLRMAIGAPGGGRIGPAIIQNIVYMLDYGMDPATAARMPRIYPDSDGPWLYIEKGYSNEVLNQAFEKGYRFFPTPGGYARIYIVEKDDKGVLRGAADPKHEGGVSGY